MVRLRELVVSTFVVLSTLALALPSGAAHAPEVLALELLVDGETADGLYALPHGVPRAVVVFGHGYGHTTESWRHHLAATAERGAVAVAMNYSAFFDLDRGAAETTAAAEHFSALYPDVPVVLFGVSMGAAVTGISLAESEGLYDWWFNVEGLANLYETWAAAEATGHVAATQIEADTGGTPAEAPEAYARRSAALRGAEIAASGVEGVWLFHALNDGLVPYDQSREMAASLAGHGVPYDFTTVVRGSCAEQGTTGTNAILGRVTPENNPACLAGHASEKSVTHPVMRTALDALFALLESGEGLAHPAFERVVDAPDA